MRQRSPASAGVVYVAFGAAYRELAVLSILWLRRFGYSGPVRVVTGEEYWPADFLGCEIVRVPHVGDGFTTRYYKTQINNYAYDTTLFLDADTLPVASVGKIWGELRFSEMCVSVDYHPSVQDLMTKSTIGRERREREFRYMSDLGLMHHPFYSSGVMLFRRSAATDQLFTIWHEEWNRFRHEDQLALVRAIARTGVKVRTLAPRWNARLKGFRTIENAQLRGVRILHFRPGNARLVRALLQQPALVDAGPKRTLRQRLWFWIRRLKMVIGAG
jgi:hypothetical protein